MTTNIKEQLEKDGYLIQEIQGTSMYPFFKEGEDKVCIERVSNPLHVDDIILFTRFDKNNKYVLHRIIEIKQDYYIVAGDNQRHSEIVFEEQIIGRVFGYYKNNIYTSLKDAEYVNYLKNLEKDLKKRKIVRTINSNSSISSLKKSILRKMFPSKNTLYQYIPLSHKYPILLPFAWVYRIFKKVFGI